ncbi:MAG: hypothetical protein ABI520_08930 [Caldimonas sp.]
MNQLSSTRRGRLATRALVALALATIATVAGAVRVGGGAAPSASSVQGAAQQPAQAQADESASLRHGTIRAIDERVTKVQVHGVWLDLVAGKTQLLRNGEPAGFETLKPGEAIRFTTESATAAAPAMKVIYVP